MLKLTRTLLNNEWNNSNKFRKIGIRIILLGFATILLLPAILTLDLDFIVMGSSPQEIGSAIGGLTAPIVGFLSTILIYISFMAQVKINESIRDDIKLKKIEFLISQINNFLTQLQNDISTFKYRKGNVNKNDFNSSETMNFVAIEEYVGALTLALNTFNETESEEYLMKIEKMLKDDNRYNIYNICRTVRAIQLLIEEVDGHGELPKNILSSIIPKINLITLNLPLDELRAIDKIISKARRLAHIEFHKEFAPDINEIYEFHRLSKSMKWY